MSQLTLNHKMRKKKEGEKKQKKRERRKSPASPHRSKGRRQRMVANNNKAGLDANLVRVRAEQRVVDAGTVGKRDVGHDASWKVEMLINLLIESG